MPPESERPNIERIGLAETDKFFSGQGWLFREQPVLDKGIDAHVEIVEDQKPTGILIGIQVKSGQSYFSEADENTIIHRPSARHVDYWLGHSLPVIIVLYDPVMELLYWIAVTKQAMRVTGEGWRIDIPRTNKLSRDAIRALREIAEGPTYIRRLAGLRLMLPWMRLAASGENVYLGFDDYVNSSLFRTHSVEIGCDSRDDVPAVHWPMIYTSAESLLLQLSRFMPWAEFRTAERAYMEAQEELWDQECRIWDNSACEGVDDDSPRHSLPFEDFYERPQGIVPINYGGGGELAYYRLDLTINTLGRAFLFVDKYLESAGSH